MFIVYLGALSAGFLLGFAVVLAVAFVIEAVS